MYSTIFLTEELKKIGELIEKNPPFSIRKSENAQKDESQTQCINLKELLQSREFENMKSDLINSYISLLDKQSEQIRYLNDCRKIYEILCRQKAREILRTYDYDNNDDKIEKIKEWAFSKKEYIHKTTNCYIDYVLWRENINELQIRIVNRKHKDLEKIEHVDKSLCFEESGNTYTVIKKTCDKNESNLAQFIVSELQNILT